MIRAGLLRNHRYEHNCYTHIYVCNAEPTADSKPENTVINKIVFELQCEKLLITACLRKIALPALTENSFVVLAERLRKWAALYLDIQVTIMLVPLRAMWTCFWYYMKTLTFSYREIRDNYKIYSVILMLSCNQEYLRAVILTNLPLYWYLRRLWCFIRNWIFHQVSSCKFACFKLYWYWRTFKFIFDKTV